MGKSVSLTHIPYYCTRCVEKHARIHPCLLVFVLCFECPCRPQCKNLSWFIFKVWYTVTTPVIGGAQLYYCWRQKKLICVSLLTHSLWIAYPFLPGVWKPGHTLDLKRAHVTLHPQCHFISKCGAPVGHQQVAYCENHLDVIERHSIRWLLLHPVRFWEKGNGGRSPVVLCLLQRSVVVFLASAVSAPPQNGHREFTLSVVLAQTHRAGPLLFWKLPLLTTFKQQMWSKKSHVQSEAGVLVHTYVAHASSLCENKCIFLQNRLLCITMSEVGIW